MPTIHDVAELARVSIKTVSRVINADPAVKESTRARVKAAIEQIDYRFNGQARQLRLGRARTSVGMIFDLPGGGYENRFHQAMLQACMETGNYLAVKLIDLTSNEVLKECEKFIENAAIEAMILLPPLSDYGPLKRLLLARNINCVLVSPATPDSSYPSVHMDDRQAAQDITEYLLSLGHRRIAHIAGDQDQAAGFLRRHGYLEAFDTQGLPRPPKEYIVNGNFTFKGGIAATEQLLDLQDPPTAIFAANDESAAAACAVVHRRGFRIPEDISVFGFDDAPIASAIWPTLSTVQQPYSEMAMRAVQILNSAAENDQGLNRQVRYVLAHTMMLRETTAPLAPPTK